MKFQSTPLTRISWLVRKKTRTVKALIRKQRIMKQKRDGSAANPDPGRIENFAMGGGGIFELEVNS